MITLASKISNLLKELNQVIGQNLLDDDGYIITEEIENVMSDKGPAHDFLIYFFKNEKFKIKCINLEDFFFSLDSLTKVFSSEQIISRVGPNPEILKDELFKAKSLELEQFFKTLPVGFEITIDLILRDLSHMDLINFLLRFDALEGIIPSQRQFKQFKKLKSILNTLIDRSNQKEYNAVRALIEKNKNLFPLLYRKVKTTYKINEFITLKLENNQTNIYVKGKLFNQCKYLLLNIPTKKIKNFKKIESIDEAVEVNNLSNALEGGRRFEITPEEEFVGHCSNMQVWAENDYDTCILHRNLAFPLLQKLSQIGDPIAVKRFKQEILKRLASGHSTVITYLADSGYLNSITDEDYHEIFKNPQKDLIENLTRGLANSKYSHYVEPLFIKFMQYSKSNFKESIIHMLENVDIELYCGIKKTGYLESLERKDISDLLNKPSSNLKEFYYKFRGKEYFISHKLSISLAHNGINDLREIEGLHRLKYLKILDLRDNNLKDIFGLENLTNLNKLKLKGNLLPQRLLENLGGLDEKGDAAHPQKFVEYCRTNAYNRIEQVIVYDTNYDVLNGRLSLSKIGINKLNDIEGLFNLNSLTHLDLSYNNLKNIDDIQLLTSLEYLNLSYNKITEFMSLESLENLKVIRLNGNNGSIKKVPNLKSLHKNLKVVDLDTPRKVSDKEYLTYLLQSLTVNDMIGLCKQFNVRRYSKLTRDKLIEFIPNSLLEVEIRDVIRKIEQNIISLGLTNALMSLRKIPTSSAKNVHIKLLEDTLIQITTTNFDKRKIKSTLQIIPSNLDNPHRHCTCKIGKKMGFCIHFWYGVLFALKAEFFQLSDWTLTILPKNLKNLIEPIQISEIAQGEYRFINKESFIIDTGVKNSTKNEDMDYTDANNIKKSKRNKI